MEKRVVIHMSGGVIQDIEMPVGVIVEVQDEDEREEDGNYNGVEWHDNGKVEPKP